jgi:hypothetical protein
LRYKSSISELTLIMQLVGIRGVNTEAFRELHYIPRRGYYCTTQLLKFSF